jgi:hypothetical protein
MQILCFALLLIYCNMNEPLCCGRLKGGRYANRIQEKVTRQNGSKQAILRGEH